MPTGGRVHYVESLFGKDNGRAFVLGNGELTTNGDLLQNIEAQDDVNHNEEGNTDMVNKPHAHAKQGTVMGVYVPIVSSMWGVLIFIRFGVIVGYTGWLLGVALIFVSGFAQCLTTLSLCTVISNSSNYKGGTFGILKRNLGANMAGAICLLYYLGMTTMASVELLGSVQALDYVIIAQPGTDESLLGSAFLDQVVIGGALLLCLAIIRAVKVKLVHVLTAAVLGVVLVSFIFGFLGSFMSASGWLGAAAGIEGVTGLQWDTFVNNTFPNWTLPHLDEDHKFVDVAHENAIHGPNAAISMIFPMFLGIFQGANKAAELKTPNKSIFKGTLGAIATSTTVYTIFFMVNAALAHRDVLKVDALLFDKLTYPSEYISIVGTILVGIGACAELLEIGPTILHAVAEDGTFSFLRYLRLDKKRAGEPIYCVMVSFAINFLLLFVSSEYFESMATVVTMFFLQAYLHMHLALLINEAYVHASWRPTFRYYDWKLSLLGALVTLFLMFYVSWIQSLITMVLTALLLFLTKFVDEPRRLGVGTRGIKLGGILSYLVEDEQITHKYHLQRAQGLPVEEEESFWNPEILCLIDDPYNNEQRDMHQKLLYLTKQICSRNRMLPHLAVVGTVVKADHRKNANGSIMEFQRNAELRLANLSMSTHCDAFCKAVIAPSTCSISDGGLLMMQAVGLGHLKPNTVLLGWNDPALVTYLEHSHETRKVVMVLKDTMPLEFVKKRASIDEDIVDSRTHGATVSVQDNDIEKLEEGSSWNEDSDDSDFEDEEESTRPVEVTKEIYSAEQPAQSFVAMPQTRRARGRVAKLKKRQGTIDVWWIVKNGGLPVLIAKVLRLSKTWKKCAIRVFAVVECEEISNEMTLEYSLHIKSLLESMRVRVAAVEVLQLSPRYHDVIRETLLDDHYEMEKDVEHHLEAHQSHRTRYGSVFSLFPGIGSSQNVLANPAHANESAKTFNKLLREYSATASLIVMNLPSACGQNSQQFQHRLDLLLEDLQRVLLVHSSLGDKEIQEELKY